MDVNFFVTCIGDALKSRMAQDSVLLPERPGCCVNFPEKQGYCGQPMIDSGYTKEAIPGMKNLIAALEDNDDSITPPAGSCICAVENYPTYPVDELEWASCTGKIAAHMQDLIPLIVSTLGVVNVGASLQGGAVYHPSYSLARKLGVKDEPLTLLKSVRGLKLLTFVEQDTCCGFGGMFLIKMAGISGEMVREKIAHLMGVRPEYSIGADVSCLLNISGRLQREGQKIKVMHIAEVLMSHWRYKDIDQNR